MNYEKLIEKRNVGFVRDLGFVTTEMGEGYARGEITPEERHYNPIGSIHGGVLFTIADTVGGAAATSRGRYVTTISAEMHYLRPAIGCKKLCAESREIKVGKKICIYEVMVTDETGREIALATMTYQYLDRYVDLD